MTRFKIILYSTLSVLLLVSCYLWLFTSWSDLGLNFFTEISGIMITIFIVEGILLRIKEKEELPLKIAYYNEITRFFSQQLYFFQDLHRQSIEGDLPKKIEDFLTIETISNILQSVNMKALPYPGYSIDMASFIYDEIKDFGDRGNKILDRYSGQLEPQLHLLIHDITNSGFYGSTLNIKSIHQIDLNRSIPRPSVLACYCGEPSEEHFQNLLSLNRWCNNFYKGHKDQNGLNDPFTYVSANFRTSFPFKKDEEILKKEIELFNSYQTRS